VKFLVVPRLVFAGLLLAGPAAFAQSSPGYFMPPSAQSSPAPVHHESAPPQAEPSAPAPDGDSAANAQAATAQAQPQLPPIPQLPALAKGAPPPAAVIGVLSVPEVMQKSTAAQGVEEIIQDRRRTLSDEARRDQDGWKATQAKIVAERSKLSDAELQAKETALQNQIAAAQTSFQARNQAIQNSAQAALGQIESSLIAVIRQVAESRGMNLVLHREQVALNVNAFDITDEVVTQLNALLPSVSVPPSVVTPGMPINTADQQDGADGGDGGDGGQ
jgi:Skp family chaperone for outer membrane proteins